MTNLRSMQVLVVEDSLDDIRILRRALLEHGGVAILHIARDGEEALNYLMGGREQGDESGPQTPDLILLDLNLPRVDGIEVLRRVKSDKTLAMIPVIMFTSSAREEDVSRSYRLGTNTYIQKPVEFQDYARAIAVLDEYWTGFAKLPSSPGFTVDQAASA